MKYRIGIGINYWDDPQGLLRILHSELYDIVDTVYLIDGRYKGRHDDEINPISNISLMIEEYPKIHYVKMRDVIQIDKRNRYFELAEQDDLDFLLICDSDQYYIINGQFINGLDMCWDFKESRVFPVSYLNGQVEMKAPRLYKQPFDYRHKQNEGPNISHGSVYDKYGKGSIKITGQYTHWMDKYGVKYYVNGIRLVHDKSLRTKKRVDWDYVYFSNNPTR